MKPSASVLGRDDGCPASSQKVPYLLGCRPFCNCNGTTPVCYHCSCDLCFYAINTELDVIDCKYLPEFTDYLRSNHIGVKRGPHLAFSLLPGSV